MQGGEWWPVHVKMRLEHPHQNTQTPTTNSSIICVGEVANLGGTAHYDQSPPIVRQCPARMRA